MIDRPAWFDGCIIGAVFSTVLLGATSHIGFFSFLLNLICVGMFVYPMVAAVRSGEVS